MNRKLQLLISLLMAMVMMVMGPQKLWAEGETCAHEYKDGVCTKTAGATHYQEPTKVGNYYQIANYGNLCWLREKVNIFKEIDNHPSYNVLQTADITIPEGVDWFPIGFPFFKGIYDGGGHIISGLSCSSEYGGLFSTLNNATIRNLGIINANMTGSKSGILAFFTCACTIENCFATGVSNSTSSGLVYRNEYTDSEFKNCYSIVSGVEYGILHTGSIDYGGDYSTVSSRYTLTNCYSNAAPNIITKIDVEDLTSGKLCWMMNGGTTDGTQTWYQNMSEANSFPRPLKNTDFTVYKVQNKMCDGTDSENYSYFNSASATPKVDHAYSSDYTIDLSPTCTEAGSKSRHCTNYASCGSKTDVTVVAASGHSYETHDAHAATCSQPGNNLYYTCANCNGVFSDKNGTATTLKAQSIPAKGHGNGSGDKAGYAATYDWSEGNATKAVCKLTLKCNDCGTELLTSKALGADLGTITKGATQESTCTSDGSQSCSVAGSYTPTVSGSQTYTISSSHDYTIARKAHVYVEHAETYSTCTTQGHNLYYTCSTCSGVFSDQNGTTTTVADQTKPIGLDTHNFVNDECTQCHKHKVTYLAPVYTDNDVTKGISGWEEKTAAATPVTSSTSAVTWDAGWYCVPAGADVTLSAGAVCNGAVHLILCDGSRLTAATTVENTPGIRVMYVSNVSFTIYGQSAGTGTLIAEGGANAAGIGGRPSEKGNNITINGGTVKATGGKNAAGIGAGSDNSGNSITINGGTVTAIGGKETAGFNDYGDAIGGGCSSPAGEEIKIDTDLAVIAGSNNPPTDLIANNGGDLAVLLHGKRYVTVHKHILAKTDETAATCTTDGNNAYWTCSVCNKVFSDANANTETTVANQVILAYHKRLTKTAAVPATCTEDGHNAYWSCENCHKVFADANGNTITTVEAQTILAYHKRLTETAAVAATCTTAGHNAYWSCSTCNKVFADKNGNTETTVEEQTIPVDPNNHSLTATNAKPATCTKDGHNAYWTCARCNKVFADEKGNTETTVADQIIKAAHTFAADDPTHSVCTVCSHSFLRYTTSDNASVYAGEGKLRDAKGNVLTVVHNTYNQTEEKWVMELNEPLAIIDEYAFCNCSSFTGDLILPKSVTNIGKLSFADCTNITSITIANTTPPECVDDAFLNTQNNSGYQGNIALHVPSQSITTYKSASVWSGFKSIECIEHTEDVLPAVAATCSTPGKTEGSYCSICGHVLVAQTEILATHTFSNDPTRSTCTMCNHGFFRYTSTDNKPITLNSYENVTSNLGPKGVVLTLLRNEYIESEGKCVMEFSAPLVSIGNNVFFFLSDLTGELVIPNTVTSIGEGAFQGCENLTGTLTIPSSVTSIGNNAFSGCSGFTGTLTIPNSITSIAEGVFSGTGFTGTLTIPNTVTSIGDYAFSSCKGFTGDLVIPNSVTYLSGFAGCTGFTSLTIPNSVKEIGTEAFYQCEGLTGTLTIPNSVTSIGEYAFSRCKGFKGDLVIPNSVTSIKESAFSDCTSFDGTLTIPNSVTSIGSNAFFCCTGFTGTLTLPNALTSISEHAFKVCKGFTGNVTIPSSVTEIEYEAFAECTGLTTITCERATPPTLGNDALYGCSKLQTIYVPAGSVESYKNAKNWSKYKDIIQGANVILTTSAGAATSYDTFDTALAAATDGSTISLLADNTTSSTINYSVYNNGLTIRLNGNNLNGLNLTNAPCYTSMDDDVYMLYASHDYLLDTVHESETGLYSSFCSRNKEHKQHDVMVIKDYDTNATGYDRHLELAVTPDESYSTTEPIALTDANQFKDVKVKFSTSSAPTYTRQMTSEWGTIVLPFDVAKVTDDYTLYQCEKMLDGNLMLGHPKDETIPAGTPMFVRKKSTAQSITFTGASNTVNPAVTPTHSVGTSLKLVGTYEALPMTSSNTGTYFIYNNAFWNVSQLNDEQTVTILPFHAYIQEASSEEGAGAMCVKFMIMTFDEEETTSIHNSQCPMHNEADAVYNLNGQRLTAPRKGINIVNGKKVFR